MDAGPRTIEQLFNKGRELSIPFFQRGYVWEEDNCQRFLDAMVEISNKKKYYFFGSVILKKQIIPSDKTIGDCLAVIDGQQRLTTICLFFKALVEIQNSPDIFKDTFLNREHKLILNHNYTDNEIFNAVMNNSLTPDLEQKFQKNKLLLAYKFFKDSNNEKLMSSINPHTLLNCIQFVGIDLIDNEDEQQIFDTINSLGIRLTTAELLKNHLYPSIKWEKQYNITWKKHFEEDEELREFWDTDITAGRNKRNNLDVLLQSYFIILKKNSNNFKLENLFQEYKDFMSENNIIDDEQKKNKFIEDLMHYSELYKKHINSSLLDADNNVEIKTQIQRITVAIFSLDITTLIPYVLYVLKNVEDEEEQNKILKFIETYIIRCFICKLSNKGYNNLFASLINNEVTTLEKLKEILSERNTDYRMPTDSEVSEKIGIVRKNSNYIPKCILYLLELAIRDNNKQNTKLLSINNYDLEHIMPQKWEKYWPLPEVTGKTKEELEEERYTKVATIGNMTILKNGLNKSLHNVSWYNKKNGKNNDGLIKYGSGLETFSLHIVLPEWNETTITERTSCLLGHILKVWKVD